MEQTPDRKAPNAEKAVRVGSVVVLLYDDDPLEAETIQIIAQHEKESASANPRTVSTETAIGKVIIGKGVGDTIEYNGPHGNVLVAKIDSIKPSSSTDS